jgi:hypothetical protein
VDIYVVNCKGEREKIKGEKYAPETAFLKPRKNSAEFFLRPSSATPPEGFKKAVSFA